MYSRNDIISPTVPVQRPIALIRHGHGKRKNADLGGARPEQGPCAPVGSGARCDHIVNEQDRTAGHPGRLIAGEGAEDVVPSMLSVKKGLRSSGRVPGKRPGNHRDPQQRRHISRQQLGLVEPAPSQLIWVKRDRHCRVALVCHTGANGEERHHLRQRGDDLYTGTVLEIMHMLSRRPLVYRRRPCAFEIVAYLAAPCTHVSPGIVESYAASKKEHLGTVLIDIGMVSKKGFIS